MDRNGKEPRKGEELLKIRSSFSSALPGGGKIAKNSDGQEKWADISLLKSLLELKGGRKACEHPCGQ